ncbi:MAG: metal ABC transporter permease [Syntrophobacteraceae bacterium]
MIHDFLSSWDLFHNMYLTGSLISVLLSMVGVLVVARDQIFIGAAVSQASTLGIALAMWIGAMFAGTAPEWLQSDGFLSVMAVLFCMGAALFTWCGGKPKKESYEAATGWIFLFSASVSILIVSKSPHGLEEIYRLLSSNIIGATEEDVWIFATVSLLTAVFFGLMRRRILVLAMDPEMAAAVGMKRKLWEPVISLWLGLAVGLCIRSSGMLYTFGCLVLPPLLAKNVCREVRSMFYVAPLFAFAGSALAFVLANHYDYPPAQVTVALFCVCVGIAWLKPRFGRINGA